MRCLDQVVIGYFAICVPCTFSEAEWLHRSLCPGEHFALPCRLAGHGSPCGIVTYCCEVAFLQDHVQPVHSTEIMGFFGESHQKQLLTVMNVKVIGYPSDESALLSELIFPEVARLSR